MLIDIRNVNRVYRVGKTRVEALKGLNFSADRGEFVSITGASGSGKSTLMNILGLLDYPDSGEYIFDGENTAHMNDRQLSVIRNRRIGFIFQSFNLLPDLTALENVSLPLKYRRVPLKRRLEAAADALCAVGLSHRLHHKPYQLSGGQRQRAAIARAIAADPELILADEPCGSLDAAAGGEIMDMLSALTDSGKTLILITHDKAAAARADRTVEICPTVKLGAEVSD